MRTIRIIRPKRLEFAANKLHITLDGGKAGDLGNGKELTLSIDENAHEIAGKGGTFVSKDFTFEYHIPAGTYSYTFQVDMVSTKNAYMPVLRPTAGERLKDDVKVRSLIGSTAVQTLLKEEVRNTLSGSDEISLSLQEANWQLIASKDGSQRVLFESEYGSTKVYGVLLQGIASSIDKMLYSTPESRKETQDFIIDAYLKYLPDYELTGDNTLHFKG